MTISEYTGQSLSVPTSLNGQSIHKDIGVFFLNTAAADTKKEAHIENIYVKYVKREVRFCI